MRLKSNGLSMLYNEIMEPLIVIVGSTAVGKTDISIRLALRFNGEIISADSRSFYKGMELGTAKPSLQERSIIPQHLIDVAFPDEIWSLAQFQGEANRIIHTIHGRSKVPFLVGGTGQYVKCIIEGWRIPPQPPKNELREVLAKWANRVGGEELHRNLTLIDEDAASLIDARNVRRTIRALEVIYTTGRKFSQQRTKSAPIYNTLVIGLKRSRQDLYARIDKRIDQMVENGLLGEVEGLLDQGYRPDLPSFSAIGYNEMILVLQGQIDLDEAKTIMKRRTREFVRRQVNWFKPTDPNIHWFLVTDSVENEIEEFIITFFDWHSREFPKENKDE